MNSTFNNFLNKLDNPIIRCSTTGKILHMNFIMDNFFDYIKIEKPKNIQDLDKEFNYEEISKNQYITRTIKIKDLSIETNIYLIKKDNEETDVLYLFNNSVVGNRTIDHVIEHIDEVVVIFNQHGVIEKVNTLSDEILPFKRTDVIGRSIHSIVENGLVQNPIMLEMLESKKKIYRNVVYPNGKVIAYTAVPFFNSKGDIKGGILTGRDLTRLIKLEYNIKMATKQPDTTEYISQSEIMNNIKSIVVRAAASDSPIFINGESGVGKELIAQTIYSCSRRRDKPYIAINCGAIPTELLESEFFGYEEGAFTGAKKGGKKGLFEEANGGTVFLDEIGELPMHMQTKLLRVIQENTLTRIGGSKTIHVDIRYISATNIPIEQLHENKRFRQDLYYRLSIIPIRIPPLRERKEDILPLIDYFLKFYNDKYDRNLEISPSAIKLFHEYNWPGNIRELKNIIERFVILSNKDIITENEFNILINLDTGNECLDNLPSIIINGYTNINEVYRTVDQLMIPKAIQKHGSIVKAAKELGVNPCTIHRKIKSRYIEI